MEDKRDSLTNKAAVLEEEVAECQQEIKELHQKKDTEMKVTT